MFEWVQFPVKGSKCARRTSSGVGGVTMIKALHRPRNYNDWLHVLIFHLSSYEPSLTNNPCEILRPVRLWWLSVWTVLFSGITRSHRRLAEMEERYTGKWMMFDWRIQPRYASTREDYSRCSFWLICINIDQINVCRWSRSWRKSAQGALRASVLAELLFAQFPAE